VGRHGRTTSRHSRPVTKPGTQAKVASRRYRGGPEKYSAQSARWTPHALLLAACCVTSSSRPPRRKRVRAPAGSTRYKGSRVARAPSQEFSSKDEVHNGLLTNRPIISIRLEDRWFFSRDSASTIRSRCWSCSDRRLQGRSTTTRNTGGGDARRCGRWPMTTPQASPGYQRH